MPQLSHKVRFPYEWPCKPRESGWCPSRAWMKRRLHEAGRLLIVAVDDSQRALGTRQGVEPTGGDDMTMPVRSRCGPDRPRRSGRSARGHDFLRRSALRRCHSTLLHVLPTTFSLAQWTRALSHGGYPLRYTVVDSTMGQMRVKVALTAIRTYGRETAISGNKL